MSPSPGGSPVRNTQWCVSQELATICLTYFYHHVSHCGNHQKKATEGTLLSHQCWTATLRLCVNHSPPQEECWQWMNSATEGPGTHKTSSQVPSWPVSF